MLCLLLIQTHEAEAAQDLAFQRAQAARAEAQKIQEAVAAAEVREVVPTARALLIFLVVRPKSLRRQLILSCF